MITIQKRLDLPDTYPLARIGALEDLLFFDIETTGFSGDYSTLYLIGCTYFQDDSWQLVQWFADTADSEAGLLHSFFSLLKQFRILIHFNGDGFDLPFLSKRCQKLGLDYSFDHIESFDIYKKIKPYRKLLGLESLKQKSIEHFLGIHRQDKYTGGQLIDVYRDYLITHERFLYDLLILHNEDDLKGMPTILPILNYPDFFEHPFRFDTQQITEVPDLFGRSCRSLEIRCRSSYTIPVPIQCDRTPVSICAEGDMLTVSAELFDGTLKHFYPNYKDYYYLIYEDTAIHKSVGEYVDKSARVPATAKTCYTRQEGCFFPQFEPIWEPVMKQAPKDKLSYVPLNQLCLDDSACLNTYLSQLFRYLGSRQL